jgi:hypothetical protein
MQTKWANIAAFEALQEARCANNYPSILLFRGEKQHAGTNAAHLAVRVVFALVLLSFQHEVHLGRQTSSKTVKMWARNQMIGSLPQRWSGCMQPFCKLVFLNTSSDSSRRRILGLVFRVEKDARSTIPPHRSALSRFGAVDKSQGKYLFTCPVRAALQRAQPSPSGSSICVNMRR